MAQVTNGIFLGTPGPTGSAPVLCLVEAGVPTSSADPDVTDCAVGSLYINTTGTSGSILYCKTALPDTWTNIA